MGGNKNFGPTEDFTKISQPSGKPILTFDPSKPVNFTDLADTIANYSGHGGKFLMVKQTEDGVTVTTLDTILDAIAAIENQLAAIFDADPIAFGKDINFEQFEAMGFRLEQLAADPSTPVNGQLWYNTTENVAKIYQNNAIQPFFTAEDAAAISLLRSDLDIAQDDILTLENLITNVADDGTLSRTEKPAVKKEYDAIIADQPGLDSEAVRLGITTEKTAYDDAITALTVYLESLDPAWDDYDTNTPIDRATFIDAFNDVYFAKQTLINKFNETSFLTIQTASQEASEAQAAASAAQVDAAAALNAIENMSLDNVLTILEKKELVLLVSIIRTEQAGIDAEAVEHGVTTEKDDYDTALNNLNIYLSGITPAWDDTSEDSPIIRNDFNQAFGDLYDTRQVCLNAIARSALDAANLAQNTANSAQSVASSAIAAANAAQSVANTAYSNSQTAIANAAAANAAIGIISSDSYLSKGEKPDVVARYNAILSEQIMLDAKADTYSLSHTAYDNTVSALTAYLNGLSPTWSDPASDTPINGATFAQKFKDVYDAAVALNLALYDKARDAAVTAAYNSANQQHLARTRVIFSANSGLAVAGRFEVGNETFGAAYAGMCGAVSGDPNNDIRFWAGCTYLDAQLGYAKFKVTNDGTLYSTKAVIAGWIVDTEAIYKGTKKISDGYATSGITLAGDGSIHAKNFFINADGTLGINCVNSIFEATPVLNGNFQGAVKIEGNDIWENTINNDLYGVIRINYNGYQEGTTYNRITIIGSGRGSTVAIFSGMDYSAFGLHKGLEVRQGSIKVPAMDTATRDLLDKSYGMIIYNYQTGQFEGVIGSTWWKFTMH